MCESIAAASVGGSFSPEMPAICSRIAHVGKNMRIVISGASGLVGRSLAQLLLANRHEVARLVRPGAKAEPGDVRWDPAAATIDMAAMEGAEAVVHLSGASIAAGRWTSARKAELRSSRVDTTRVLVDALARLRQRPQAFVCASAIGYYGDRGDEVLTEASDCGTDFLALLTRDWEGEAVRAQHAGIRTVRLRFGVILAPEGGALPKMLAPLRWGIGGRLGSGRQWMSWTALEDAIEIARNAISDEHYAGAINVVAPNPVRNTEFTRIAAAILNRPAIFPTPAFALRLALGEMAQTLLLASQRVQPARLSELGYSFRFESIEPALRSLMDKRVT